MSIGRPSGLTRRLVRERTASQMNSFIVITRAPNNATLDLTTGRIGAAESSEIYRGRARVRALGPRRDLDMGSPVPLRTAVISIPMTAPMPWVDDLVVVLRTNRDGDGSEGDTDLDNRSFRVQDVDGGGYFGDARRMQCEAWFPARDWPIT